MQRAATSPPDLPGYRYVQPLGSGGFSDVFLYEQDLPRRRVAVKVLLTDGLSEANRAAFVTEANVMAQLSTHPYIVTIYQAAVAGDDRPYFVMEYCAGPSLSERYRKERFSVADALRTGIRLSGAVATAHAAGILHRDIKPANVLTNDYGWPALTDFGISSAVESDVSPFVTTTLADALAAGVTSGGTAGTGASIGLSVPWSPAEMFLAEPQPDVRSDVFSLAATIYTILAGRSPFEIPGRSNGTLDLIGRIERGAITPLDRDDLPASLLGVLRKGMALRATDRFESALAFGRALQRVELELGYAQTTIDVPNLVVDAPVRPNDVDDADATRARSVSTLAIQAPAVPPAAPQPVAPPQFLPPVVPPESLLPVAELVEAPRTQPASISPPTEVPRRRVAPALIGTAIGVVLIAVIVVGALVLPGIVGGNSTKPTADPSGGGVIDVSVVPTPKLVSAVPSADGTSVTFTWSNPKPKPGDSYLWARAETPDANTPTSTLQAVVSGVVPGSKVCINVSVLRDGTTSPNPLAACTS